MTAEVISYGDVQATFERDKKILRLRMAGIPKIRIAEEMQCSLEQVEAAVTRLCGAVTPQLRVEIIRLTLERIDELYRAHYQAALGGSIEHTNILIKLMERQSRMLGLDAPPSGGGDALQTALNADRRTSTQQIKDALLRVVNEKVIDGEVVPPR